jgi:hypothetical protein
MSIACNISRPRLALQQRLADCKMGLPSVHCSGRSTFPSAITFKGLVPGDSSSCALYGFFSGPLRISRYLVRLPLTGYTLNDHVFVVL